jgi:hypothetical protein
VTSTHVPMYSQTPTHSLTHTFTPHTHSLTNTRTHSLTNTHTLTLSYSYTLTFTHAHTQPLETKLNAAVVKAAGITRIHKTMRGKLPHIHTHTYTHSHTLTHTYAHIHTHTLSHTYICTHTHTHTLTHTYAHIHTQHTLTHTLSHTQGLPRRRRGQRIHSQPTLTLTNTTPAHYPPQQKRK